MRGRVARAADRPRRSRDDVKIVAVSKYAEPSDGIVESFARVGLFELAENRPQRLLEKIDYARLSAHNVDQSELSKIYWHFIGSLQKNKVRKILPYVSLIHSVDSIKLHETLERILDEEARSTNQDASKPHFPQEISALLEVHISNDDAKQGFLPSELPEAVEYALSLKRVKIRGLMGMAGLGVDDDETRRQFRSLRELSERLRERYPKFTDFKELSMGMSGDFEIAVEEGATILRLGSILYPDDFFNR